jgi:hypothetical protein
VLQWRARRLFGSLVKKRDMLMRIMIRTAQERGAIVASGGLLAVVGLAGDS